MVNTGFEDDWSEWLNDASAKKPVNNKATSNIPKIPKRNNHINTTKEDKPLTQQQETFCQLYVQYSNGRKAAIEAGYSENGAEVTSSNLLRRANVAKRIKELKNELARPNIATGEQVMQFFSDVMNGKVKDQFGLEASLSDRTKAAVELAKRTVDLDQKLAGKPDTTVEIKLDWKR